jgi:dihydrolipoamide dehydrogenase
VLDARAAMSLTTVPESIVIVGGGSIGVEFAHLFHEFGAAVTIVELLPSLLPLADADQSKELERALRRKGVKILTSTKVLGCEADPAGLAVRLAGKKGEERLAAGVALLAAGVAANSQGLGLTEAGVALDPRGNVETDAFGRTSRPGVYAIGDVAGPPCLAHVASAEGILAVEHMAGLPVHPIDYRNIPACTYGTPEVASVGLTEKEAAEGGREVKVGRFPLRASGKALAAGESAGFVKVVLDAGSQELLGLHLVGAHASELLLEGSLARTVGAKAEAILRTVHPHPTLGESIHEAVADALGKAIHV